MGFLKKLFSTTPQAAEDSGIYLYVKCDRCSDVVRLRLKPKYELVSEQSGYVSNKIVVDSRCYQRMSAAFHFNQRQQLESAEIDGGELVSEADYKAAQSGSSGSIPV